VHISDEDHENGTHGNVILDDFRNYLEEPDCDLCECDMIGASSYCEYCEGWKRRRRTALASYTRCTLGCQLLFSSSLFLVFVLQAWLLENGE
jgi:hypothetical protein